GAVRSWSEARRISNRHFLDEFILYSFIPQDHSSSVWMLNGNVSKGLDFLRGMLSLRGSYMGYDGSLFQNGIETPYSSDSWTVTPRVNSSFSGWLNGSYELNFTKNRLDVKESGITSSSESIWQTLSVNLIPDRKYYARY
ncbi:hypothetical protein, partial [Proteiniphilum sp.]|uniref:hypothetical protein n=1 Tax=Proteiniphilum sp. TaxID=1926877 RepID=UPI0033190B9D